MEGSLALGGDRWAKCNGEGLRRTTRSVDNSIVWLPGLGRAASMRGGTTENRGDDFVAKRKKGSKVQRRANPRRANSAKRPTARKVAKAKPKRAPVKKAPRKVKRPVAPVVETVAAEAIEQPAPGAIAVTEVEANVGK